MGGPIRARDGGWLDVGQEGASGGESKVRRGARVAKGDGL